VLTQGFNGDLGFGSRKHKNLDQKLKCKSLDRVGKLKQQRLRERKTISEKRFEHKLLLRLGLTNRVLMQ